MAQNFLGALRAQSEGQGNLSMHPQGDNLYGYGPTTHFLAYFRLVLGATNTPPAPCFRPVLGLAAPAAAFRSFSRFGDWRSSESPCDDCARLFARRHARPRRHCAALSSKMRGAARREAKSQKNPADKTRLMRHGKKSTTWPNASPRAATHPRAVRCRPVPL